MFTRLGYPGTAVSRLGRYARFNPAHPLLHVDLVFQCPLFNGADGVFIRPAGDGYESGAGLFDGRRSAIECTARPAVDLWLTRVSSAGITGRSIGDINYPRADVGGGALYIARARTYAGDPILALAEIKSVVDGHY